jgi:hypothetical protein
MFSAAPMAHNVWRHNATPSTMLFYQMSEALSEHFSIEPACASTSPLRMM